MLSIIIRCRNEAKHIGKLLKGIMAQTIHDVEIIVVDSGSTDETLAIVAQFPVKIIHIRPQDFSFGYALNVGCRSAKGDILLFASAHVYPLYKDWLEKIVQPFDNEGVALVYGKQQGNEVTKFSEHQVFAKWFPAAATNNQLHPFCNNANCAVRRSVWETQPYNETLTGLEDLDWAKKAQANGWKIAYCADATIVHVHEETWKSIYNRYRREAIALRLIMIHEKFNFFNFIQLLTKNILNDCQQALHEGIFFKKCLEIVLFRWMQFYGTYRGFKESYLLDNHIRERFYYPKGFITDEKKPIEMEKVISYK
jgi:rhamnosyltransferase